MTVTSGFGGMPHFPLASCKPIQASKGSNGTEMPSPEDGKASSPSAPPEDGKASSPSAPTYRVAEAHRLRALRMSGLFPLNIQILSSYQSTAEAHFGGQQVGQPTPGVLTPVRSASALSSVSVISESSAWLLGLGTTALCALTADMCSTTGRVSHEWSEA